MKDVTQVFVGKQAPVEGVLGRLLGLMGGLLRLVGDLMGFALRLRLLFFHSLGKVGLYCEAQGHTSMGTQR